MNNWHDVCITDKSGKQHFKVSASPMSTYSEIKNLKQHLEAAKKNPAHYKFLDVATAVIMLDGTEYESGATVDYDEFLAELGL
jgi:hypothetical protein